METVMKSLELMVKGMAAIFFVTFIIYFFVTLMLKYVKDKE